MSATLTGWLAQALATDAPVLPTPGVMQVWLHLGWSVVLAWLGVRLVSPWGRAVPVRWVAALGLAAWAWVPGLAGPAYWLGLAFQAPSVASVLVCALLLGAHLRGAVSAPAYADRRSLMLAATGVLAGWALLLDSFAVLPLQLYALGFSPVVLGLVVLVALLPWVAGDPRSDRWLPGLVVPVAALVLAIWRLPTGNAWDAVLDPWLWLALQIHLAGSVWSRYKNNS